MTTQTLEEMRNALQAGIDGKQIEYRQMSPTNWSNYSEVDWDKYPTEWKDAYHGARGVIWNFGANQYREKKV